MRHVFLVLLIVLGVVAGGCGPSQQTKTLDTIHWTGVDSGYQSQTTHYSDGRVERHPVNK